MKAFRALLRVSMTALLRSISPGRGGLALAVGVLALVPLISPAETTSATSSQYQASAGTSVNAAGSTGA